MEDQDLKNGKPVDSIESEDSCDDSDEYDEDDEDIETFESMGLDQKLLHAIADIGWNRPTLIQAKAIPLALKGHDILARARTGTGKTGAFILPILEKILNAIKYENNGESSNQIRALVLAPSKELCNQIQQNFNELTKYCRRQVNIMDLSQGNLNDKKDFLKIQTPDVLIGTPKKVLEYIESKLLNTLKDNLKYLVIDESDLMFSFGYYDDLLKIFKHLPSNGVQHYLMSATLNTDVNEMKKLILNNPIILKLEEPDLPESELLKQYHIEVFDDEEKFVLINALLKLGLIIGKTIIFLSNIDRCYRLRLFLEQFGIRSCVLNSELPITIRCQIIEQFNSGLYDIIIASDEKCLIDPNRRQNDKSSKNNRSKSKVTNSESSIARGIDFKFVSNIINFDFPTTVDSYIHRVGRTARGINNTSNNNCEGNVLSFILPEEQKYFERLQRKFQKQSSASDSIIKPYQFRMNELEAFRYRSRDVLRSITTIVIRNTRLREIQRELLQSKKLQTTFFQKNPKDYKLLKYDRSKLQSSIKQSNNRLHLKDMPDYMIPQTLKTINKSIKRRNDQRIEQQALMSYQPSITKKRRQNQNYKGKHNNSNVKNDPLQTFRMNMIQKYKNKKRNKSRK